MYTMENRIGAVAKALEIIDKRAPDWFRVDTQGRCVPEAYCNGVRIKTGIDVRQKIPLFQNMEEIVEFTRTYNGCDSEEFPVLLGKKTSYGLLFGKRAFPKIRERIEIIAEFTKSRLENHVVLVTIRPRGDPVFTAKHCLTVYGGNILDPTNGFLSLDDFSDQGIYQKACFIQVNLFKK
jgi:hypothetical protein